MADQVAEVKGKVDIVEVIGSRVNLKPAGKYHRGLCPFHSEKSPSFYVSSELQIFKCFGCGESGDVFTFLERYEGMNFREALESLAEKVGVKLEKYRTSGVEKDDAKIYEILNLAGEYYHYLLTKHGVGSKGREYLKKRGLSNAMIDAFGLGFAPDSWDSLVKYLVGKKKYGYEEVEKAGLIIKGNRGYYDRFRGRVMFSLRDFRGRVVGFSGRLLEEKSEATARQEAKYINTPETSVYHKRELLFGVDVTRSEVRKKDEVVVVEGEFDVLSSYMVGVKQVVGIKGSAFTEDQIGLLRRLTRNLVLCLDADAAGDAAMRKAIELADKMGMNVKVVRISGGKDPDDLARSDARAWKDLVKKAISVYEFYIESSFEKFDSSSGLGKKKISEELAPILSKIENKVEQAHYVAVVAKRLEMDDGVVRAEMERSLKLGEGRKRDDEGGESVDKSDSWTRQELLERYVWGLLLQLEGKRFRAGVGFLEGVVWSNPGLERLVGGLSEFLEVNKGDFEVSEFVSRLPSELSGLVSEVYLQEEVIDSGGEVEVLGDLEKAVNKLKEIGVRVKMKELGMEIGKVESKDDLTEEEEKELKRMQKEFSELAGMLVE